MGIASFTVFNLSNCFNGRENVTPLNAMHFRGLNMTNYIVHTVFVSKEGRSFSFDRIVAAKRIGNVYTVKEGAYNTVVSHFKSGDIVVVVSRVIEDISFQHFLSELRAKGVYSILLLASYDGKREELVPANIRCIAGASIPVLACEIMPAIRMLSVLKLTAKIGADTLTNILGDGELLYFSSSKGTDIRKLKREVSRTLICKKPSYLQIGSALVGLLAPRAVEDAVFKQCFQSYRSAHWGANMLTFGGRSATDEFEYYVLCR